MICIIHPDGKPLYWTRSRTEEQAWERFSDGIAIQLFRILAESEGYSSGHYEPLPNEYVEKPTVMHHPV